MIINIINLCTIRGCVNKNYSHLTYRPDQSWRKGNGKTRIEPAVFPRPTHHLGLLLLHPWYMAADPVDKFLLRYVVMYKCRALLGLLTDKDQRVLTFAARGVVQEMPGYEYRLLLLAWRNQGDHLAGDLPRFGGAF